MDYDDFFGQTTGLKAAPYPYQRRLAIEPWPDLLDVPAGLGKTTAIALAWIYKRKVKQDFDTPLWFPNESGTVYWIDMGTHESTALPYMLSELEEARNQLEKQQNIGLEHHGKVRMSLPSAPDDALTDVPDSRPTDKRQARGVRDSDTLLACKLPDETGLDIEAPQVILSLDPMELGLSVRYGPSWRERMQGLLERLAPFRLAYLEALVRASDMPVSRRATENKQKLASLEAIVRALNDSGVRYLIAGGLAVNAHGYLRLTHDIDLVIALDSENVVKAFEALKSIDYRPLVPITAEQFAEPNIRQKWIDEKGMYSTSSATGIVKRCSTCLYTSPSNLTRNTPARCWVNCFQV